MCHPGDNEFMPVDKTWGIMPPLGMHPSTETYFYYNSFLTSNCPSPYAARNHPPVSLEQFSFLESFFNKIKLKESMWAKLVTLDTLHWYYDELEPTTAACRYDAQVRQREFVTLYLGFLWLYFIL